MEKGGVPLFASFPLALTFVTGQGMGSFRDAVAVLPCLAPLGPDRSSASGRQSEVASSAVMVFRWGGRVSKRRHYFSEFISVRGRSKTQTS